MRWNSPVRRNRNESNNSVTSVWKRPDRSGGNLNTQAFLIFPAPDRGAATTNPETEKK